MQGLHYDCPDPDQLERGWIVRTGWVVGSHDIYYAGGNRETTNPQEAKVYSTQAAAMADPDCRWGSAYEAIRWDFAAGRRADPA